MRIRDRILHATAGWHTTTDPACVHYKATREGTAFDARSRGVECRTCLIDRLEEGAQRRHRELGWWMRKAQTAGDVAWRVSQERDELIRQPRATILCPECNVSLPVPLAMSLGEDDEGRQYLEATPDMSDMWAHAWTHAGGDDE